MAYFLLVKGNQPRLQRAVFDAVQQDCPRDPEYTELDQSHGRTIRRSVWVTDAGNIDCPHVRQARTSARKSCTPSPASARTKARAADLAKLAGGQWGIESVYWLHDTAYAEDTNTGYAGNGPQAMGGYGCAEGTPYSGSLDCSSSVSTFGPVVL